MNSLGIEAHFIPFGGVLTHLLYPDKTGVVRDLVLGYDDPTLYLPAILYLVRRALSVFCEVKNLVL